MWLIVCFKMQNKVVLAYICMSILHSLFFRHSVDLDALHCYEVLFYQSFTSCSQHLLSANFQIRNIPISFLFIYLEKNNEVIKIWREMFSLYYAVILTHFLQFESFDSIKEISIPFHIQWRIIYPQFCISIIPTSLKYHSVLKSYFLSSCGSSMNLILKVWVITGARVMSWHRLNS